MHEVRQPRPLVGFGACAGQVVDPVAGLFWVIHAIQGGQRRRATSSSLVRRWIFGQDILPFLVTGIVVYLRPSKLSVLRRMRGRPMLLISVERGCELAIETDQRRVEHSPKYPPKSPNHRVRQIAGRSANPYDA